MKVFSIIITLVSTLQFAQAFAPSTISTKSHVLSSSIISPSTTTTTTLNMAKGDDELNRFSRAQRSAGVNDRVVELKRPLGLVLNEDDNGNVFVETVAPKGNAARTGLVSYLCLFS
jgi:hypothetical protein